MTNTTLPEPLVPAEVDLNGYGFMPMLHHRVLQSTLFIKSTGDEFKAAFALWCASWSEKPAASLPDDEEMLEHLSRSKTWKKVRERALHGWVKCSDGRLYHPVLASLALDAWARREEFREVQENKESRQERWRRRVKEMSEQLRALGVTPPFNANLKTLETMLADAQSSTRASTKTSTRDKSETSTRDVRETALTETVTETETKERARVSTPEPDPPPPARASHSPPEPDTSGHQPTAAGLVCRAMKRAGLASVNPGDPRLIALCEQGATEGEFEGLAAEAVAKSKGFAWVLAVLQARRADAAAIALKPLAEARAGPSEADRTAEMLRERSKPMTREEKALADEARKRAMAAVGRTTA